MFLGFWAWPLPFCIILCAIFSKGFCSTYFPRVCFHITPDKLVLGKQFLGQSTWSLLLCEKGWSTKAFHGWTCAGVSLCIGVEIQRADLKQDLGKGRGRGAVSGQQHGTGCRKLRQARWLFCRASLCPGSASYHETKFYMSQSLLYSQLCSGITSLDTLSEAIYTQYRWSTCFLHGQDLFFISCKQWK